MRGIFVDTSHLIAVFRSRDAHHSRAVQIAGELAKSGARFVTTTAVFAEFLAHASASGQFMRRRAVKMVREFAAEATVTVVHLTEDLFQRALDLYEQRAGLQPPTVRRWLSAATRP